MKHRTSAKVVSFVLCVLMLLSIVPVSAVAEWDNVTYSGTTFGTNGYYNVISKKDYVLVPGAATETEMVLNNSAGTRRQVIHVIELDPSNPDVSILPGYYNIDKLVANPADASAYKAAGVTDVANYYDTELGYQVVGAMNTDLDYTDNAPRVLVYNGQILSGYAGAAAPKSVLYVWNNNGEISCEVTDYVKAEMEAGVADGTLLHAISVSFAMVVRDGELVTKTENHSGGSDDAARSMVGVKEDGTLVLVMNDGRGANNSKGFCTYEEGECMLALGCKWAANCDGGGSSSFVTRRAGEEDIVCRCVPCDGAERPTKSSVIIVSNVAPTGVLDTVNIDSDYDFFAPNTAYTFGTTALDTHGYAMDLPADAVWALSEDSFGTIDNGTFVSNGTLGNVSIQIMIGDELVGEKAITVANPATLHFAADSTTLPYGKSTDLAFTSLIGEAEVYLDGNSFTFALSNAGGTLDGLTFTAGSDESITKTVITATYLANNTALTYTVNFGKGSEIIYDFEDGIDGWMSTDETVEFLYNKGYIAEKTYLALNNYYNGTGSDNYSECVLTDTFVATAENGYVHNGEKALGVSFDLTQCPFNEWNYGVLFNATGGVLRDVANNKKAITLGMWVRMPENFVQDAGTWANQLTVWKGTDADHLAGAQVHFQYKGKNINALTEADIPENRWIYVTAALPTDNYVRLADADSNLYRSPSFLRTYIKPNVAAKFVWYIDDITLDYSSAVDDRVPPTISGIEYATSDTNITFENNTVISAPGAAFNCTIADDNSGLDLSTAAIYVDSIKLATTKVAGSRMYCDTVALGRGSHKVVFEIADKQGNYTTATRIITNNVTKDVDKYMYARTEILLSGHNDSGTTPMPGSVYYIDVSSSYSDALGTVEITLELNDANKWILDQIEATDGYTVTYKVDNEYTNKVTFTCTSTRANGSERVLFSVPVSVYNPVLTAASEATPSAVSGRVFTAALSVKMTDCTVAGSYGNYAEFAVAEMAGNRTVTRHEHTAAAVEDVPATCSENGYTGRTYCAVCSSVADWGTTIVAEGHQYEMVDDTFVCSNCGDTLVYTGIFEMNGGLYYLINGTVSTGWQSVGASDYAYADPDSKMLVVDGSKRINGITYQFDENGYLVSGVWANGGAGLVYSYGPGLYRRTWQTIDGKTYYFGADAYMYTGIRFIKDNPATPATWYNFGTDGVLTDTAVEDGVYQVKDDYYIVVNGETQMGLYQFDGAYYYGGIGSGFDRFACVARNQTVNINSDKANGLVASGTYYFGDDGKMVIYDGPVNGYFYKNGSMVHAYALEEFNGSYYYIGDGNKLTVNKTVYVSSDKLAGTPYSADYYAFDADGKMILKNGPQADGYLYINGVKQKAYQLVNYDGSYYFIGDGNKYAVNKSVYVTADKLAGTPYLAGYYDFGADGKMVLKNGPQADGYLYIDGVKQKAYQLVNYDGSYYFIGDGNKYAVNKSVYVTADKLAGTSYSAGYYDFDADGKMILKNGPQADGYLYINGVKQKAYQLVNYDGSFYFIGDGNKYAVNKTVYVTADKLAGTSYKAGNYYFDASGKMVID